MKTEHDVESGCGAMARGDNQCPRCKQWAGEGHTCLTVVPGERPTAPTTTITSAATATADDVTQRCARAKTALTASEATPDSHRLRTLPPTQFDAELAALYEQEVALEQRVAAARHGMQRAAGGRSLGRRGNPANGGFDISTADAKRVLRAQASDNTLAGYQRKAAQDALTRWENASNDLHAVRRDNARYQQAFQDRGGWTRAFLVVSSGNGHVHKDMTCSTCRPSTTYNWMTDYSGQDENAIVEAAGERACTVCYPTAPVAVLNSPTRMFSPDEIQAQADREARAAAKVERDAAKAAKAITTPDGEPIRIKTWADSSYTDEVRTEVTARRLLTEALVDLQTRYDDRSADQWTSREWLAKNREHTSRNVTILAEAIAAKHGLTADELLADAKLQKAVQRKVTAYYR